MHELLTVSLGHQSHTVITHLFNLQYDDENDDHHATTWGTLTRPRLLSINAQGVFSPEQHDAEEHATAWDGPVFDATSASTPSASTHHLDTLAHFPSLRTCTYLLPSVHHNLTPLHGWFATQAALNSETLESMHDRLRKLTEECDHVQGVVVVADDSYGSSTQHMLEYMQEELVSAPVFGYDVIAADDAAEDDTPPIITRAMAAACFQQHAAIACEMNNLQTQRLWYNAAVALDDVTSPHRMAAQTPETVAQLLGRLRVGGPHAASAVLHSAYAGRAPVVFDGVQGDDHPRAASQYIAQMRVARGSQEQQIGLPPQQPVYDLSLPDWPHYHEHTAFSSASLVQLWHPGAEQHAQHAAALRHARRHASGDADMDAVNDALEFFEGQCV